MTGCGLRRATAAVALATAMGVTSGSGGALAATAPAPGRPEPPSITVTNLVGPEGRPMASADHINEHGLVTGAVDVPSPAPLVPPSKRVAAGPGTASYLGPGHGVTVLDLSDRGQVVGYTAVAGFGAAFSWRGGAYTSLVDPPPGDDPNEYRPYFVRAEAVNERGQVVGLRADPRSGARFAEVAVWQEGEVTASTGRTTDLEHQPMPRDINDHGQVVVNLGGQLVDGGATEAAVWRIGGRVTRLGTLGGAQSWGSAIDERGRVAGVSQTAGGDWHAFLWRGGRLTDLGTLGGATSVLGEGRPGQAPGDVDDARNDRGEVVGTSDTASGDRHAFLWRAGRIIDLGTLGGATSQAVALNNRGQVVGVSETASGERHAFVWQRGRMTDLGALAGDGASEATDINDQGQVVGRVGTRAVLWAVPLPR